MSGVRARNRGRLLSTLPTGNQLAELIGHEEQETRAVEPPVLLPNEVPPADISVEATASTDQRVPIIPTGITTIRRGHDIFAFQKPLASKFIEVIKSHADLIKSNKLKISLNASFDRALDKPLHANLNDKSSLETRTINKLNLIIDTAEKMLAPNSCCHKKEKISQEEESFYQVVLSLKGKKLDEALLQRLEQQMNDFDKTIGLNPIKSQTGLDLAR